MSGTKITAIAMVSVFLGLALGYAVTVSLNPAPKPASNDLILSPSNHNAPAASYGADVSSHTQIAADGKVRGRVLMIELFVENEQDRYHFLVIPDAGYTGLLNSVNKEKLRNALMIEILYADNAVIPKLHVGQHLEILGPHVTDNGNGWNEIDPANVIRSI